jgi:tetratricopeptide (TPR) repeat protein
VAHHGILFLDEIALLPTALQPKLLTVIEEQAVRRLGGTRSELADVWILTASSEELAAAVKARGFRKDLFHRLAVVTIFLPPLRERGEDILRLAEYFLARACADYGMPPRTFAPDARAALLAYSWPGNVRELCNVLEQAALLADDPTIAAAMLRLPPTAITEPTGTDPVAIPTEEALDFDDAIASVECPQLIDALRATNWNVTQAATRLGISRNRIRYQIEKHGLGPGAPRLRNRAGRGQPAPSDLPPLDRARPDIPVASPLRWEQRYISLLRADLVFAADIPPDTSREIELLIEKVRSFGGQVEEISPRAIVAAFGVEPVEDAPTRAALAAMAIQKAAERVHSGDVLAVASVRAAIHVEHLLVGQLGGSSQIDLEGKSAASTVLEWLMSLEDANAILVSDAAAPFLERRFELVPARSAGALPRRAYRLTRREQTGFGLGGRALSPFVGRERELGFLDDRLAQVERGQGQLVGIVGEPGVGKSRFVYELTRSDRLRRWRVLGANCVSYGIASAYLPVADLLKRYFQVEDRHNPRQIRDEVVGRLQALDEALKPTLPALLWLLEVPVEDPQWERLDPAERRQRTLDAVKRLLLRESQVRPLVLVFEDLHWVDSETQAWLDNLVEGLPNARCLLLVTYRPEYEHRWGSKTYYTQLRLDPLSPACAEELLRTLLGADRSLEPLKRLLIQRTEGNPFFLEESLHTLLEAKVLAGERVAYRLAGPLEDMQVADTVHAVLAARIDRLPGEEKRLLQTAAVLGNEAELVLIEAVADLPKDAARRGLAHFQAAEFLYETRPFPDLEYTFKHALTHEVAYGSLLPAQGKAIHAKVVEAIERLYPDRLDERVEDLAHHASRGELWEKAASYLRRAGAKAFARSANHESVSCLEQALDCVRHLPATRETREFEVDLCLDLRNSLYAIGEFENIFRYLRQAEVLAPKLEDPRRLCLLDAYMCRNLVVAGRPTEALSFGERAQKIADQMEDFQLRITTNLFVGMAHHNMGDYPGAEHFLQRVIGSLSENLVGERCGLETFPAVMSRAWLTKTLCELGQFDEAIKQASEAARIAKMLDHPFSVAVSSYGLGNVYNAKGDFSRAIEPLERGFSLSRDRSFTIASSGVIALLGYAYVRTGRVNEGVSLLESIANRFESLRVQPFLSFVLLRVSEGHLVAARLDDAARYAEQALRAAREDGERGYEAHSLRLLAEIALHGNEPERARASYHQAMARATELGMRPLIAHCHAGLARLHRRTGEREQAEEQFSTAETMYREMGMRFWLEKTEAEVSAA